MVAIARNVRAALPEAQTVALTWSDDGSCLIPDGYHSASGHRIGYMPKGAWAGDDRNSWEHDLDQAIMPYCTNLEELNESVWEPFTTDHNPLSGELLDNGDRRLKIEQVLAEAERETADVKSFTDWAEVVGITCEDLDELIYDVVASQASDINNGGPESQIEYLIGFCGVVEARALLVDCQPESPHPLYSVSDLRGSMAEGYDDRAVNTILGRISEASGLRLVCVWDLYDEAGVGGNSQFYVATEEGRLHKLVGDLWRWLNGDPDDPDTPHFPGAPSSWIGPLADKTPDDLPYDDGFCNYAIVDETQSQPSRG
ncbi:hypothetical protein DQ384_36465 [Sphaerisporangium album]|uniref:Uncharacterized protein n=2 Tax=Sphaerisporangium album TaxID=509200 RepID=A0A367ETU8_9ACTN|nr:hypothetical protein DQ384_36465 [Sphaerisporangium album]